MKMIIAVVRDEFAGRLTDQLTSQGFSATKLASSGGFLKAGNTTFLIGVQAAQVDQALAVIRDACPARKSIKGDLTFAEGSLKSAAADRRQPLPSEVAVGGATVFVLDVADMFKV